MFFKAPPKAPIGVLTALAITTSRIYISSIRFGFGWAQDPSLRLFDFFHLFFASFVRGAGLKRPGHLYRWVENLRVFFLKSLNIIS